MLLTKLKLNYFGRFHEKEIELKPGINLIFGENESGKSTLHAFIRGMFFGIERLRGRASASREDLYTRYLPWDYPGAFGGSMDLEIGGKAYRLTRSFHASDKSFTVLDLATGREVKLREGIIGELIPGLSESAFRNTVSIEQRGAQTDSELALQVRNYIANLSVAKSKEVNVAKAVSSLNEQRKYLESLHNPAQLNALKSEIEEGIAKEERMDQLTLQLQKLLEQGRELQKRRKELEAASDQESMRRMEQLPAILEKYRSYQELERQVRQLELAQEELKKRMEEGKSRQQALEQLKEDKRAVQSLEGEIKELDRQALELDRKQEELDQGGRRGLYYYLLPAVIAAILAAVLTGFKLSGLLLAAGFLLAGGTGYYIVNRKNKKISDELNNKVKELHNRNAEVQKEFHRILGRNQLKHVEELNDRQEELMKGIYTAESAKEQLEDIQRRKNDIVDSMDRNYDSIMNYARYYIPAEELTEDIIQQLVEELRRRKQESSNRWDRLNEEDKECRLQIERLRWEISRLESNEEDLLRNQETYRQLVQQQETGRVELEAIKLALSSIQELSAEIHDSFGQQLNHAVSEVILGVTKERYKELKIDEKLGIKVGWKGDYVLLERLSTGTVEQIYLALRLAVADLLLGKDEVPLLLDDSFAFYDDKRVKTTLTKMAERKQLLLFTCHRREQQLLEELKLPYHLVDLS